MDDTDKLEIDSSNILEQYKNPRCVTYVDRELNYLCWKHAIFDVIHIETCRKFSKILKKYNVKYHWSYIIQQVQLREIFGEGLVSAH